MTGKFNHSLQALFQQCLYLNGSHYNNKFRSPCFHHFQARLAEAITIGGALLCTNWHATANTSSLALAQCFLVGGDDLNNTSSQDFNKNKMICFEK